MPFVVAYTLRSAAGGGLPVPHMDTREFFETIVRDFVRKKVRKIIGKAGFAHQDRDDLEQELTSRLLKRFKSFDPNRGSLGGFLKTVGSRIVANLLRDQRARKRDRRLTRSLHVLMPSEDNGLVELAHTISQREQDARLRQRSRSEQDAADFARDLHDLLGRLPPRLRAFAELLKEKPLSGAAQALGLSPTKARLLLRLLRQMLVDANIRDYF
jgi:RNA polymerase sigma factor (sigma-70 family)